MDLDLALATQDHSDKESLALIGLRESQAPKQQQLSKESVGFDARCVNCDTDPNVKQMIYSKFKIACLQYKPSLVTLKTGLQYARADVFDMQKELLSRYRDTNDKFQKEQGTKAEAVRRS